MSENKQIVNPEITPKIAAMAEALKAANQKTAADDNTRRYIKELDAAHPVSTELFFTDFYDINPGTGTKVEGKKLSCRIEYRNGIKKSRLLGICKKKKNVWKWISLTNQGMELLKQKKFDYTLKNISAIEKQMLSELKESWSKQLE